MKPHLYKANVCTLYGMKRLWVCAGDGLIGHGHNPLSAYDDWLIRSLKA